MDFRTVFFLQDLRPALRRLIVGSTALAAAAGFAPAQSAPTETVLYRFKGGNDGDTPVVDLIFDNNGALYGTTEFGGGPANAGVVFKLTPPVPPATQWTKSVLYRFTGGSDGANPVAGLIFNSKGALYGTTAFGGGPFNGGTVFKLKPPVPPATKWTETVLYRFTGGSDGANPLASLIFNSKDALFGTTEFGGGPSQAGTVFKLKPPVPPAMQWTEKVLYSFKGGSDGAQPFDGLIFDSKGALYGTTQSGGGPGVVFKLTPPGPSGDAMDRDRAL